MTTTSNLARVITGQIKFNPALGPDMCYAEILGYLSHHRQTEVFTLYDGIRTNPITIGQTPNFKFIHQKEGIVILNKYHN